MARPHKQTVDYFPHDTDASDGKTLTIIQAKYGNDGYSFWFKLLQLLGKTPGHYYDFNKTADWEFLLAKTHQNDTEKVKAMLDTLAVLDAIDAELYAHGVIWCQKFVDGVADAYDRTVDGAPKRPDFLVNVKDKRVSVVEPRVSVNSNAKKTTEIQQTKLNYTKLNKTKVDDVPVASFTAYKKKLRVAYPELDIDAEWERCRIWYRDHKKAIKSPSLALGNWCKKEQEIQNKGGKHERRHGKAIPGNEPAGAFNGVEEADNEM
ncbi:unnamed protein product [marine sediment metagenome]|uniref:Lin1244/Lin1753-like N-terminal domain-containing protein n=1 Tax=marine sediment metagenome TaxID=412755 RepID=X1QEG0_9ZZZZ